MCSTLVYSSAYSETHMCMHTHTHVYIHTQNSYSDFGTVSGTVLGQHELKQHKPWFDEECLGFFRSKEAG